MPIGNVVDISKIHGAHKRFLANHDNAFERVLDDTAITAEVKHYIGSGVLLAMRSGNLLKHTQVRVMRSSRGAVVRVTNDAKYAWAQNSGSGLYGPSGAKYPITPKGKGYPLRFYWARKKVWVSTFKVMHPGVKATHFLGVASDLTFKTRLALLRAAMNSAARHF